MQGHNIPYIVQHLTVHTVIFFSKQIENSHVRDIEYSIQGKPEVTPVVHAARKVPVALKEKVQEELNRMKKFNIITKVDEPTEWVNSMVGGAKTQWDSKNIPGSNRPKRGD